MAEEEQDKQHEPSQKKLDDARRRGEVPRSNDLNAALSYAGFLLAALVLGGWIVSGIGTTGRAFLEAPTSPNQQYYSKPLINAAVSVIPDVGGVLLALFAFPVVAVCVGLVAQRALVFAPEKLKPKLSRISPLSNAKNKFGRSGLFEFAKSTAKLLLISSVLFFYLRLRAEELVNAVLLSPGAISRMLGEFSIEFLSILVVIVGIIGAIDFLWQVAEHRRKNRMSHKELRDEAKESEGDPHMKQARRQKAQQIALNSMLADIPKSNVVIVNPEHYAVALKWDPSFSGPPICVAKGVDTVAARIREAAGEAGVPIHRDPPTARAIHAAVEIGGEILPDQYRAVAAAIRFADKMREIARRKVLS